MDAIFFTVQRCLYGYLVFSLIMLLVLFLKPQTIAPLFKKKRVSLPLTLFVLLLILLFFRNNYQEYQQKYKKLPENIKGETIEYVRW